MKGIQGANSVYTRQVATLVNRFYIILHEVIMFYLGIDVAKAKLDCCLLLDEASSKRKTKVIYKTSAGYLDLLAWPAKQQVTGCGT
jgi:hypothetical protein